jgi:uncharacterized protein
MQLLIRILATTAMLLLPAFLAAQDAGNTRAPAPIAGTTVEGIDGDWDGVIKVGARELRSAFHIKTTAGATTATMDSIDQGVNGIPVSAVGRRGDSVRLEVASIGGAFEGQLSADARTISGEWMQAGLKIPLMLVRRASRVSQPEFRRPQNPAKPYPYGEEDVTFENAASRTRLAGTLTLPHGSGRFPAVVLIAGSGPNDRNETVFGHQIFLVLADHLTRKGIAVLRFDKRGIGKSTGDYASATTADFASDAEAALAYLKSRPEINQQTVGLVGHSEGGLIAPIIAARDSSVAFIVLMAGPGQRGDELMVTQNRLIARASGASPADLDAAEALNRKVYAAVINARNADEAAGAARAVLVAGLPQVPQAAIDAQVKSISSSWVRFYLAYDPAPALRQVKCPVLAINGSLDRQVLPDQNLRVIRKALQEGGNKHFEVEELPGLNHLFQTAKTGSPAEYTQIEETMSPAALDKMANWILKQ